MGRTSRNSLHQPKAVQIEMKKYFIIAATLLLPLPVSAQNMPADGRYHVSTDGGTGTLTIDNGNVDLIVTSPQSCSGRISSAISVISPNEAYLRASEGGYVCTVVMQLDPNGRPISLNPEGDCSYYHGASCSFYGMVTGPAVATSIEAIDVGFASLSAEERANIQRALADRGLYSGSIDGQSGPQTRRAIIAGARADLNQNADISLEAPSEVVDYLESLLASRSAAPTSSDETSKELPAGDPTGQIMGAWTCESADFDNTLDFSFSHTEVYSESLGRGAEYFSVNFIGQRDHAIDISLDDGQRIGLFAIEQSSMVMMTDSMIFDCTRN